MDQLLDPLLGGIALMGDPSVWLLIAIGTIFGVFIGAMPGMGITLAFGLALPFTFVMDPVQAVAFLLSISVGGQYGNSLPAILLNVPGSPASALTAVEGYALHKQGKSGLALGVMYIAALGGQLVSIPFFILMVVPLSGLAYVFLAPEQFSLYVLGMAAIVSLTGKNLLKGLIAAGFGLIVGLIGLDPLNNTARLTMGVPELRGGVAVVPAVIGLLALSELFRSARQTYDWAALAASFSQRFPRWREIRPTLPSMAIGTVSGTLVGAIPGASGVAASMIAYQQAQLFSKKKGDFGRGSLDGIAANEAAQNASNAGELVPTLGLGIPASGSMVLLMGALTMQGLIPGPFLTRNSPELLDAAVVGLMAGSLFLIVTGWWMARLMLRLVTLKRAVVVSVAIASVFVGVFSIRAEMLDVTICLVFGVIGYFMLRYGFSTPAAALAVVLAEGFERTLRMGLNLFDNSFVEFVTRPITAVILLIAFGFLTFGLVRTVREQRSAVLPDQRP